MKSIYTIGFANEFVILVAQVGRPAKARLCQIASTGWL